MARLTKLSRSVAGKVVLVTGAASGMGLATAELFADEGAKVAVTDLSLDGVNPVVDRIKDAGGDAAGWALDVGDGDRIKHVVAEIVDRFGGLDVLVNNAGFATFVSVADAADDEYEPIWDKHLNVLLKSHVRLVRAALPHLKKSGEGRVINIASTEGLGATSGGGPYTAAKHGVIGLTRSLATELGTSGVTFNCVCPGPINTGITADIPDKHKEIFARRRVPLERYAEPEEVAHATLSLALPASSYINGVALPVDGGLTIRNA